MSKLQKIITDVGVVESIAITQEGGETDFKSLEDIEMTSERLSYRNVLSDATTVKSRYPFEEGDTLVYNGDVLEDSFTVVAYTGTGASQDIQTGIESYDINYDAARTYTAGSGNNTEYAFDRATMKLYQYINATPASGATLVEGADFTEIADGVEIDFKSSKVWIKQRSDNRTHQVVDSLRGIDLIIQTETTIAEVSKPNGVTALTAAGITVDSDAEFNINAGTFVAWQWAYNKVKITTTNQGKRAIVAYTEGERSMTLYEGSGTTGHEIPHGLGVAPDSAISKALEDGTAGWNSSFAPITGVLQLNTTTAANASFEYCTFTANHNVIDNSGSAWGNNLDEAHIVYSEASKEGQIKIATYTGTGAVGNYINCGFEPEYVIIKRTDSTGDWGIYDSTRAPGDYLYANSSAVEGNRPVLAQANGFLVDSTNTGVNASGGTYIYIAYAKGSKALNTIGTDTAAVTGVSTTTTKNFSAVTYTGTGASLAIATGIASVDFSTATNGSGFWFDRSTFEVKTDAGSVVSSGNVEVNTSKLHIKGLNAVHHNNVFDGLRGKDSRIATNLTSAESDSSGSIVSFDVNGVTVGTGSADLSTAARDYVMYQTLYTHIRWGVTNHNRKYVEAYNPYTNEMMVVYQGSGAVGHDLPHSVGVALDYMEVKNLTAVQGWGGAIDNTGYMSVSTTAAITAYADYVNFSNDSTTMSSLSGVNGANEFVMYGKAKSENWTIVEYTGTGAVGNYIETKDVFGNPRRPRRVIFKRTDGVAGWYVHDSSREVERGIILNSSGVEFDSNDNRVVFSNTGVFINITHGDYNAANGEYIALVEFDTAGDNGDSYYDVYEGTHNASIEPTSLLNTADTKLEWSLNDGVTYHEAVVATRSEVDGVVTTTFDSITDTTSGNRGIKHKVTKKLDGSTVSRIRANIKKGA